MNKHSFVRIQSDIWYQPGINYTDYNSTSLVYLQAIFFTRCVYFKNESFIQQLVSCRVCYNGTLA